MKWEHYVFHIIKDEIDVGFEQERMTELGKEGWELVSVVDNRYYFKRLKQLTPTFPEFPGVTELIRTGYDADIE